MRRLTAALIGVLSLLLPAGAALAADYIPPRVIEYPQTPYEVGSNWYLRGDIGYKHYGTPDAHFDVAGYGDMINETITDTGTIGAGAGYRFNQFFRIDGTIDYEWPGNFHGNLPCPGSCLNPYSDEYADFSAWTGLINAYVDLGNYGAFTPYVGAGIGVSNITTSNVHYLNPGSPPTPGSWGGASTWNLAWAFMAGTAINLNHNWAVDVNYRYLHLGDAESAPTSILGLNEPIHYDGIDAQEVRVGLRYYVH